MSLIIHCPSCAKRYEVGEDFHGRRVRCKQCGKTFTAAPDLAPAALSLEAAGDLLEVNLSQLPSQPAALRFSIAGETRVSNPSGGPTDVQMRLASGGMLGLGIILLLGSLAMEATQGVVYLAAVGLAPLSVMLGVAGLISPNVVRACGKYGGHLPPHYKVIGWGVIGLSFVVMVLMLVGLFLAGFEPHRPGASNKPGLSRSQTAAVLDRIRTSYESSPNAGVLRKVSFPVFWMKGQNPDAAAERVLAGTAGYVPGSFKISPDRKKISFHYRGEKEIANQYALLLPGPTEIYMAFTPEFED